MNNFESFKSEIVAKCKSEDACNGEFKKLLASENDHQLWSVLLSNYAWCNDHNIFQARPEVFVFDESFSGSLYLSGCDIKGITLPTSVGGDLYLSGCDIKGIDIPEELKRKVIK